MHNINFNKYSLNQLFVTNNFEYLNFSNEVNVNHSHNAKQLRFFHYLHENKLEILIQLEEVVGGIDISVIYENVCRNIPIEDSKFDCIINEVSRVVFKIKKHLETEFIKNNHNFQNVKFNIDSMCVEDDLKSEEFKKNFCELSMKEKIYQIYEENKPDIQSFENYPNNLFVFGTTGRRVAEILVDLSLASFKKTHSGYLIKFNNSYAKSSSDFIRVFSNKLNQMGIPTMAIPLSILEYLW